MDDPPANAKRRFMLKNTTELYGTKLAGLDGEIGHVKDFYFDDLIWVIRYLVVDTGSWLTGRLVLLSPHALGKLDEFEKTMHVKLHRKQIENSPSIELHKPVSRQYEIEYYKYYGWPAYWRGGAMWGFGGYPVIMAPSLEEREASLQTHQRDDKHLRSTRAVTDYTIHATDGEIGVVSGFEVDGKSWAIRQLEVETGHWYSGKEILIPPTEVERISYKDSKVFVKLTKASIQNTADHKVVNAHA